MIFCDEFTVCQKHKNPLTEGGFCHEAAEVLLKVSTLAGLAFK